MMNMTSKYLNRRRKMSYLITKTTRTNDCLCSHRRLSILEHLRYVSAIKMLFSCKNVFATLLTFCWEPSMQKSLSGAITSIDSHYWRQREKLICLDASANACNQLQIVTFHIALSEVSTSGWQVQKATACND